MKLFSAKLPEFWKVSFTSVKDMYTIYCGVGCLSSVIIYHAGGDPELFGCENSEEAVVCVIEQHK